MQWEQVGALVGVLSPLVGVPLTMIALYLRAIREHQTSASTEITRRIDALEATMRNVVQRTGEFEREYATKEEWIRESMLARQRLEHLTELVTRIQAELETGRGLTSELSRVMAAMVDRAGWPVNPAGRGSSTDGQE